MCVCVCVKTQMFDFFYSQHFGITLWMDKLVCICAFIFVYTVSVINVYLCVGVGVFY